MNTLLGLHHVSALSAHIQRTHRFYSVVLGLRPIIKSVNQDEPTMYHLFYTDGEGSPGSDFTVFDLPHATREQRGNNSISRTGFRIDGAASLGYWRKRLEVHGIATTDRIEADGSRALDFEDHEGTQLSLIDDRQSGESFPWEGSPVPPEHQIRGLGPVEITVPEIEPTDRFLRGALGLELDHTETEADQATVHHYRMGSGGLDATLRVVVREDLPRARYGAGGVHHLALRAPSEGDIGHWAAHLEGLGYPNSGLVDRHYFRSVYVREPNGVLFEIASDGPGFDVDGPPDSDRLTLPPLLEPRRAEIEARLLPLTTPVG